VGWDKPHPLPVIEGKRAGGETQIPRDVIDAFGFPLQVGDAVYPIPCNPIDPRGYPLTTSWHLNLSYLDAYSLQTSGDSTRVGLMGIGY